jgi:hypothetical protein
MCILSHRCFRFWQINIHDLTAAINSVCKMFFAKWCVYFSSVLRDVNDHRDLINKYWRIISLGGGSLVVFQLQANNSDSRKVCVMCSRTYWLKSVCLSLAKKLLWASSMIFLCTWSPGCFFRVGRAFRVVFAFYFRSFGGVDELLNFQEIKRNERHTTAK